MNASFNAAEDAQARRVARELQQRIPVEEVPGGRHPEGHGRTAITQARLILLVMINLAQLWVLSATIEAALARRFGVMLPLIISSGVCWLIALSLIFWWRPASRRHTSTGYIRQHGKRLRER